MNEENTMSYTWILPIGDDPRDRVPFTPQDYRKHPDPDWKEFMSPKLEGDKDAPKTFPIFQETIYHGKIDKERMIMVVMPGYVKPEIEVYILDNRLHVKTKKKFWPTNGIDISVKMDEKREEVSFINLTNGILVIRLKLKPILRTKAKKHIISIE